MRNRTSNIDLASRGGIFWLSSFRQLFPRRPKNALCLLLAIAATGAILTNALFLQAGPHPAPIFADTAVRKPAAATGATAGGARATGNRRTGVTAPGASVNPNAASRTTEARHDPIAEILEPTNSMIAVQRALAEFGYGQIKPTGTLGPETKAAIERFERERRLPVTGQLSDRLTRELSAMKGGPL